ncbi:hypothetical protein SEEA1981_11644 [Salmonella enterica subsp. enterica serovar Agona str. 241981]|nr:hypothetical protein SEEA1981_11644 [Salmonella enterica subsp. enterica serovar Agona str. 241981]
MHGGSIRIAIDGDNLDPQALAFNRLPLFLILLPLITSPALLPDAAQCLIASYFCPLIYLRAVYTKTFAYVFSNKLLFLLPCNILYINTGK